MKDDVLVSICCLAYNHEPYIRECLDGFMMQKTDFPFEVLIHDDASTDRTADIIREYEEKYPEIIKPIYQKENQYSKGVRISSKFQFSRAKGKYIAICEGDDYWTDPLKLQKQVDFLEVNPDYSVCFHRYRVFNEPQDLFRDDNCGFLLENSKIKLIDVNIDLFLTHWITQPVTMMFRVKILNYKSFSVYKYFRDQHFIYHLLLLGKGCVMNFYGAVYRENENGIHGCKPLKDQVDIAIKVAQELYENNGTTALKKNYLRTLDWGIYSAKKGAWGNNLYWKYVWKRFKCSGNLKKLLKQLLVNQ